MRIYGIICLALVCGVSFAEPADYETTIELDVSSVGPLLSEIEERLEIDLRSREISLGAELLEPGSVFQRTFDLSHGGITFEAMYQVARLESALLSISFSAYQRRTIEAICQEFLRASNDGDDNQSAKSCDLSQPQTFRM